MQQVPERTSPFPGIGSPVLPWSRGLPEWTHVLRPSRRVLPGVLQGYQVLLTQLPLPLALSVQDRVLTPVAPSLSIVKTLSLADVDVTV